MTTREGGPAFYAAANLSCASASGTCHLRNDIGGLPPFWCIFGLAGAAFSWVVYNLFSYVHTIPRICAECGVGISLLKRYAHVFRFLGPAAIIYGAAWTICRTTGHDSIGALGYGLASTLCVLGPFMLIGRELRGALWGLLRNFRTKYAEMF